MPVLVPRTHAKVDIKGIIKYIVANKEFTDKEDVKREIQKALNIALEWTITETKIWIETHVPKRSGDLQASLIKYLERSRPPAGAAGEFRGVRLVLGAGVEIDYAEYVHDMTPANVRHLGTWREHSIDYYTKKGVAHHPLAYSKGKPVFLDDPRAVGYYHEKMVEFAKERLTINLAKAKYDLQNTSKSITSRNLSKLQVTS